MPRLEWTISNLLSLSRLVLLIPILYFFLHPNDGSRLYAAALMLLIIITDFFDGHLARKFHQETDFGKIVDPLADKICVGAVVIVLAALRDLPEWFVLVVIGRDIFILLGGLYIAKTKNIVLQSNWAGKGAVSLVAALLIVATLRLEELGILKLILLWGSVTFLAVSFAMYIKRFYDIVAAKTQAIERAS